MKLPKKLTQGPIGNLFYALLGVLVAVIFYYVILRSALATDLPMVAVVSNSMYHGPSNSITENLCGIKVEKYQDIDSFWNICSSTYRQFNITKEQFMSFPSSNGFHAGDMPIVKGSDEYKVGDIIVYTVPCPVAVSLGMLCPEAPIIHRIVKINEDGTYQTKGDNNDNQIPYEHSVKSEWIHGKVIFVVPKVGYFKMMLNKMIGAIK